MPDNTCDMMLSVFLLLNKPASKNAKAGIIARINVAYRPMRRQLKKHKPNAKQSTLSKMYLKYLLQPEPMLKLKLNIVRFVFLKDYMKIFSINNIYTSHNNNGFFFLKKNKMYQCLPEQCHKLIQSLGLPFITYQKWMFMLGILYFSKLSFGLLLSICSSSVFKIQHRNVSQLYQSIKVVCFCNNNG
jgi:hypothetical protein